MRKCFAHIFFITVVFINAVAHAQTVNSKLYLLDNDEADKPKILALYQNSKGLILCGTTKGLYRFDGFDFSLYNSDTSINAGVTSICETKDKRTLIGYSNGNIGELKNNIIHLLKFEEGLPKVPIKSIIQDKVGVVWIGTAGEGIYYIKNNRLYNINEDDGLSDNYIYKLVSFPPYGVIAASDRGANICYLKNDKKYINTYTSKNGLPDNIVRTLFAANGILWLGMQDAGIGSLAYNNYNNPYYFLSHWNYGQVNDILASSFKVYVATEDSGLISYALNKENQRFDITPNVDHTISKINCLLKDREGNIWVAGDNELLRAGKEGMEKVYQLTKAQAEQIHTLHYTSDSALWFNIPGGLTRLYKQDNKWKDESFTLPQLSNTTITALYEDSLNNLWVGSLGKGVMVFNHEKQTQYKLNDSSLRNNNTITINGNNNAVWVSGLEGVVRADLNNGVYNYTNFTDTSGIGNKYVYNIFCDNRKRVWFATDGEGILMLHNGKFFHFENMQGYTGNVVYKILQDKFGNIWYATYDKGIVKYDGKEFINFATQQGLSDMNISGFLNAGDYIAVLHKNIIDIIDPATNKISYIDKSVASFDINNDLNACTNDKAGNIYFVSGDAIYSYTVSDAMAQQPTVSIDKAQLLVKNIEAANNASFRYNENNLSFFFTGIYYSEPEKIQYEYKLDNYDKEWISTKDRVKNFPSLPPGSYTFRVRVSLSKNFENASEASFSFVIEKPFWMYSWFYVAIALVLAALLYLFIKQREKHINNLNTLKNEKIQSQLQTLRSQVNPHFLFNSLNTLVSEIETNPDNAVMYVEKIADFYRSLIAHREKDLILLEDELNILRDYSFLQEKRFSSGLEINIDINADVASSSYIPPLVLQMLVENAIKHNIISKETPLIIEIKNVDDEWIAIRNNINKKMQPEKRTGLGLQNIQNRYALLHIKKVVIESDEHFFTVKIPLIKS